MGSLDVMPGRSRPCSASGSTRYVASGTSVYASRDAGAIWQRRPFTGGKASLFAAVPSDPTVLYVVSDVTG